MNDYRLIFDFLHSKDLSFEKLAANINKMKADQIFGIVQKLKDYINIDESQIESEFNIMANSTMTGESLHFNDHQLRINRVESLLSSSLLFADTIWIKSPLDKYNEIDEKYFSDDDSKEQLIIDLVILYLFRVPLESGIVRICKTKSHFCRHCLIESLDQVPDKYKTKLNHIDKQLTNSFIKGAEYTYKANNGKYEIEIKPKIPNIFPEDEYQLIYDEHQEEYEKALSRKSNKIYQSELRNNYLIQCDFVNPILNDIIMHDYYSSDNKLNYFTDRPVDMELIKQLNGESENQIGNKMINALNHNFPFVTKVPIHNLIELRVNEKEAFVNYRDSVESIIRKSKGLSEKEIIEAVKDEIRPNLNKIDTTIKKHKSKLGKGALANIGFGLGTILIGMKAGFLPDAIRTTLAALGFVNHGGGAVNNIIKLLNKESEISDEKYYFLWKLRKNN